MVGPNLRDQLPVLKSVVKWFSKDSVVTDSLVFKLHHQVTTFLILIGFVFTVIENYIDSKTITCHTAGSGQLPKYAHSYCWIHGAAYVRKHLQGRATGCYVDPDEVDTHGDFLVTSYYLWLPYLLSFLFTMAKMPHSIWKRFFENNLLSSILGGTAGSDVRDQHTEDQQQQQGQDGGQEEAEEGEGKDAGENKKQNKKQENNNQKKKQNKENNKNQKQHEKNPLVMARSFVNLRSGGRYSQYQLNFFMLEASNLLTLLAQIMVTHWILNYKFWLYGSKVMRYLSVYGEYWRRGENIHNPMCELFPTEVSCNIRVGASTGGVDKTNYLCILQNNLFNQKYFFIMWLWWMFLFVVTLFGVTYRITRILLKPFSRYLLERKVHCNRNILNKLTSASSGDFFVLELVIDSLKENPQEITELLTEIGRVWNPCLERGREHRYEKLRNEPNKMGNLVNFVGNQNRPPPYLSQKL